MLYWSTDHGGDLDSISPPVTPADGPQPTGSGAAGDAGKDTTEKTEQEKEEDWTQVCIHILYLKLKGHTHDWAVCLQFLFHPKVNSNNQQYKILLNQDSCF